MATTTKELLVEYKELTHKVMKVTSDNLNDVELMLEHSKEHKDIALTLEKMGNVISKICELESTLGEQTQSNDIMSDEEKLEVMEASENYYDNNKARIKKSIEYLRKKLNKPKGPSTETNPQRDYDTYLASVDSSDLASASTGAASLEGADLAEEGADDAEDFDPAR